MCIRDRIGRSAADGFDARFRAAFEEASATLDSGRPAELVDRWAAASQRVAGRR